MDEITERIKSKLNEIERKENVRILYACESGSRAWGFASPDSDYDVRFIYVRPAEHYLRLDKTRDVIEYELNEIYDINGWDLKKMMTLLHVSNPAVFEWACSPAVYRTTPEWEKLKLLFKDFFIMHKMLYHYISMAKNNMRNYFCGEEIQLKKYLYILRPLLACEWIMKKNCPPPTEFSILQKAVLPPKLNSFMDKLLAAKKKAGEKQTGHHISELDFFIQEKICSTEAFLEGLSKKTEHDWNTLNRAFYEILFPE